MERSVAYAVPEMRDLWVCSLQKADSRPGQEKTENKEGSTAKTGHYDGSVDPEPGRQDELLESINGMEREAGVTSYLHQGAARCH